MLRGADGVGLDRQITEKMSARAKRFNIQGAGSHVKYEDIVQLYER